MIRILSLTLIALSVSCASAEKSIKQQHARIKFSNALSSVEIQGDPVELTLKLLDEAYAQMEANEITRVYGSAARFGVSQTPGYKIVVGDRIYSKFREKFMGEGIVWRDQIVDMKIALNSSDVRVEAPVRIFELVSHGVQKYTVTVREKEGSPLGREGEPPVDVVVLKARMVRALDAEKYSLALNKIKKQYPEFEWQ